MGVSFGIRDCKIAPRTAQGTWGAVIDVPFIQMLNVSERVLSAEGTGDDRIVTVPAIVIAGAGQCRMQGVPLAVLALIHGAEIETISINTISSQLLSLATGTHLKPFAIAGQGLDADELGDKFIFVPNAKVTSDITLGSMQYGTLSTLEFSFIALDDGDYTFLNFIERADTDDDLTIPPYSV